MNGDVRVFDTPHELSRGAADLFAHLARRAQEEHGMFRVALSGGSTPRALYERLAASPRSVDWERVQVFFSDERFVPPDSDQSNYHLAYSTLLSRVPIPERFIHRVATVDIPPEDAASLYAQGIRRVFEVPEDVLPRFDLVLLGLGPDGHTASLFPGTEALMVTDRLVAPNFVPQMDSWRITFTYPLINAARTVTFLVEGAGKAAILHRVLEGDGALPAARVRPTEGALLWVADRAALRISEPGIGS